MIDQPLPSASSARRQLLLPTARRGPDVAVQLPDAAHPGIYAWFVDDRGARDLSLGLGLPVAPGLIYAGQAGAGSSSATLASRIRGNHVAGNSYGSTLRLSVAAILRVQLGLTPSGGRHMEPAGEVRLTDWMRNHLTVSLVAYPDRATLDQLETAVLDLLDPPLNIAKRPASALRRHLTGLRRGFR